MSQRSRQQSSVGGYEAIHRNLMAELASAELDRAAVRLELTVRGDDRLAVPMMGRTYLVGRDGVAAEDGRSVRQAAGSVLAGYVLRMGSGGPSGRFVTVDQLTPLVSSQSTRLGGRFGPRLARVIEMAPEPFESLIASYGGRPGEVAGSGSRSWILELLPQLPVQIVFHSSDEEFPCDARLLVDSHATRYLEFEFLAVLLSVFVDEVVESAGPR